MRPLSSGPSFLVKPPAPVIREEPQAESGEHDYAERAAPGPGGGGADGRFQADWAQSPKISIEERCDLGVGQDPALLE